MNLYFRGTLASFLFIGFVIPWGVQAKPAAKVKACVGEYALCAASTGRPTGKTITVRAWDGSMQVFPEALVVCPILKGVAIAGLNSGTMGNRCKAPKGKVYSTWSPKTIYPQEASNFSTATLKDQKMVVQQCAPQDMTIHTSTFPNGATQAISQCWSMVCDVNPVSEFGVPTANCYCPIGQYAQGGLIEQGVSSITGAGQGDSRACNQYPVSAPEINQP